MSWLKLRCPSCQSFEADYPQSGAAAWSCGQCAFEARLDAPVLRMLPPERAGRYQKFEQDYLNIRKAEGRGSQDPDYYRTLPFAHRNGDPLAWQWEMRAKTYRYFEKRMLAFIEQQAQKPLNILDLGAGNGWLSYRLAKRGHRSVAIDLLADPLDGLAAARHFRRDLKEPFPAIQAEFDNLPVAAAQFDLVIFNASFHYSVDYWQTLQEARRCLVWGGQVIILDSPIYEHWSHGERMREERHEQFEKQYGFRSDSVPSMEYLDQSMLNRLAADLNLRWRIDRPWYGLSWHMRPWKARLQGRRPPSRFWILTASWTAS